MKCEVCGSARVQQNGICATCGARVHGDEYAPPTSGDHPAGIDDGVVEPWELKRWRVSNLSWASVMLACFVPPLGLIMGIAAVARANRRKNRPGNKAVAIAAIATAFYMGFMVLYVGYLVWAMPGRGDWGDSAQLEEQDDELERLLREVEELNQPEAKQPSEGGEGAAIPATSPWGDPESVRELEELLRNSDHGYSPPSQP